MTGFRNISGCHCPERLLETGRRPGRTAGIGTLGAGRALSRSRETAVELPSDSAYADSVSRAGKKGLVSQPGRDYSAELFGTHHLREQWSRNGRWSSRSARPLWSVRPRSCRDDLGLMPGGRDRRRLEEGVVRAASYVVRQQ
jgi:hypothetical protein